MKVSLIFISILALFACKTKKPCTEILNPACICTEQYEPVCGCNDKTYGNACQAECLGIKKYTKGECAQTNKKTIEGINWQLIKIVADPIPQDVPQNVVIHLQMAQGKASGSGGCNSYGGDYTIAKNTLTIRSIISTKMYCDEASKLENQYLSHLEKSQTYTLHNDGTLEINCGDMGNLMFKKSTGK